VAESCDLAAAESCGSAVAELEQDTPTLGDQAREVEALPLPQP
jgi:hypothetical protein